MKTLGYEDAFQVLLLQAAGEPERAELYLNQTARMPEGWQLSFFGMFRGRPSSPLRICGYLDDAEKNACAASPTRLAAVSAGMTRSFVCIRRPVQFLITVLMKFYAAINSREITRCSNIFACLAACLLTFWLALVGFVSNENDMGEGELALSFGVAIVLAIAGIACAAYGLKFVLSATKMRFHFFWFALAGVLVAPAVLMATGFWRAIPVALHWVVGTAFALFVVYELFVGVGIARHYRDKATAGLDYVVVLGAQVLEGKPGRTFVRRLDVAYEYLCDNAQTRCIVCGAQGSNESVPEAHAGRAYLVERGIADNRILLEEHSFSTAQNLRNAAKLVDPARDSIGIVTNDYHLGRSLALARKAGMEHACGIAVRSYERFPLNNIVRESMAWAKDVFSCNA